MAAQQQPGHEWPERIKRLLQYLKITQSALAGRLGVSPATVSRWIQGKHEPTAQTYVALGNLAKPAEGVYFWERAGMDIAGMPDASIRRVLWSLRTRLEDFKVIAAARQSKPLTAHAVAIPVLNVMAWGDRIAPRQNISLAEAEVEDVLVAPLDWCPNPETVLGMHFHGDSMMPVIAPDSIVFVDTAATERERLRHKLIVVSHRDLGFKIARLQRVADSDLLVSANHKYAPLDISNASKWKIFGEVMWWITRDANGKSLD